MTFEKYNELIGVAKNSTSPIVLNELSRITPPERCLIDIRVLIANNPCTNKQTLEYLSDCESISVKLAVAKNANTPKSVLVKLAKHPADSVREAVLKNPNISEDVKFDILKSS